MGGAPVSNGPRVGRRSRGPGGGALTNDLLPVPERPGLFLEGDRERPSSFIQDAGAGVGVIVPGC